MRQPTRKADAWIAAGLCVLLLLVVGAMGFLSTYKNTAGNSNDAPARWPSGSRIESEPGLPVLVMFAHPMCSCTRASLSELRALVSEFRGRFTPYVLSALPQGVGQEWMSSNLWKSAESIEGVRVMRTSRSTRRACLGREPRDTWSCTMQRVVSCSAAASPARAGTSATTTVVSKFHRSCENILPSQRKARCSGARSRIPND